MSLSRRAIAARIAIALLAVFMVGEAAATIRLDETSRGPRHAYVGELIQVGLTRGDPAVTSSDQAVVKPIGVTNGSPNVDYFIAALPGKSVLKTTAPPCRSGCTALHDVRWAVEIDVG
jgi:hypothetical protein